MTPRSACGVIPNSETKFEGAARSLGTESHPAVKEANVLAPPLTLRLIRELTEMSGGSMRFACCGELMRSLVYMFAGIRQLLATRRPNIVCAAPMW
jgi:hypothetical protein